MECSFSWLIFIIPDGKQDYTNRINGTDATYLEKSIDQILRGNYTEKTTLLGTIGQMATGIIGIDAPAYIRDLHHNFTNWEWSWSHAGETALNAAGLLPVVGGLKYGDEVSALVKGGSKSAEVAKGASGAKPNISPKTRLPRTNGKWSGEPGNGKWFSNKPEVNKITGGKGVEFKNGSPDFSPWKKGKLKFKEGVLDGSSNDFNAVYDKIKQAKGFTSQNQAKTWLREKGLTPHHKSSTEIELIPKDLHKNVPHIGSASELRGGK